MAEAVGIVLAIAPLIISAFEHYDHVATYYRTFAKYTHRVKASLRALNVQEVIFRKANERLLCHCVEEDQARQMLLDVNHLGWQDAEIAALYLDRLGDSRSAFEDCIGLIAEELAAMKQKLNRVDVGEDPASRNIRKRVLYAFKESNIESGLAVLREKNQDLVTLIDVSTPRPQPQANKTSAHVLRKDIERFCCINQTADSLYQALGQACTKHTDHQAHLSLETIHAKAAQIRFTIAFSRLSLANTIDHFDMSTKSAWLTVESSISGRLEATIDAEGLSTTQMSLKRVLDAEPDQERQQRVHKPAKRLVRFQEPTAPDPTVQLKFLSHRYPPAPELENLCTGSNFCDRLQKFVHKAQPSNQAIGFLHFSGESKHLVYVDSKAHLIMQHQASPRLTTLRNILNRQASDDTCGLSIASRVSLARQLATGVLQFQSTPWLGRSWGSERVLISQGETDEEDDRSSHAFISAQIDGPNGPLTRAQSIPSVVVIRNQLLFSLGVMLLELAFQKPLMDMTREADQNSAHPGHAEYSTADRLSRQVAAHMGPRYAELVRKCIHCFFASGNDLRQAKLQTEFYQDIVCELEKLERRVKDL